MYTVLLRFTSVSKSCVRARACGLWFQRHVIRQITDLETQRDGMSKREKERQSLRQGQRERERGGGGGGGVRGGGGGMRKEREPTFQLFSIFFKAQCPCFRFDR